MNKTQLYIQLPETNTETLRFSDTYLASSSFGLFLGLEFSYDVSDDLQVGQSINIDKDDKSINTWIDGPATIIGITNSSIYATPSSLVFTDRPLQLPIVFTSGEAGTVYKGTTIQSNWTEVDLSENVAFPITFNIADVREINNRNGAYSKTISIPGTKNNNDVFKYIFDIQGVDNYDTRIKVKCNLVIDTIPVLEGYIQLNSIVATDNKYWTYECTIFGENANFSKEIDQNARLEDLDFSQFDHNLTIDTITQSWYGDWSNGYYYPLIDYNQLRDPARQFPDERKWRFNYLKPSIYVKQYWDKIFETYGYSYESEFLNSDLFKNLIIPTNKSIIENDVEWRFNSSFKAGIITNATYSTVLGAPANTFQNQMNNPEVTDNLVMIDSGTFFYDPQNIFVDPSPGSFFYRNSYLGTIPKNQKIILNLDFKITAKDSSGNPITNLTNLYGSGFVLFYFISGSTEKYKIILAGTEEQPSFAGTVDNQNINTLIDDYGDFEPLDLSLFERRQFQCIFDTSVLGQVANNGQVSIEVGLTQFKNLETTSGVPPATQESNYNNTRYEIELFPTTDGFTDGTIFFNVIDEEIIDDQPLKLNTTIPGNIKQIDFVNSIINMFNLYFYQDKTNPKNIFIEPRDIFYDTTQFLNWSNKLDIDKNITQSPIIDRKKRVLLSYKEDKDLFNNDYKQKTNEIYGQYEYLTNNEIVLTEQKISLIFSPTPLSNRKINDTTLDSRFIYSQILNPKQPVTAETFNKVDSNIRILFRKKIDLSDGVNFNIVASFPITNYSFDFYPYAGHLDDPFNPENDLNFAEPKFTYYANNIDYTGNNLYKEYYEQFFEEIYGPESKLITAYVYLNAQDILDFDYRKLIYLDNISSGSPGYFRVNKIEWDAFNKQSYKVELIKVLNNFKSRFNRLISIGGDVTNLPGNGDGLVTPGGNTNDGDGNIIGGYGNISLGDFNIISGKDNSVKDNASNNIISGDSNSIYSSNSITTGYNNKIFVSGNESSIIGGASNSISGRYSSIIAGSSNDIQNNSRESFIIGGNNNKISYNSTGITASVVNTNNFIIGGENNIIESGITQSSTDNSFIIGGYGNTIEAGLTNSVILNGQNFTATQSNTIYLEGNVLINGNAPATVTPIPSGEIVFGDGTGITSNSSFNISAFGNLNLGSTNTITGSPVTNTSFLNTDNSSISAASARSSLLATSGSQISGGVINQSAIIGGFNNNVSQSNSVIVGGNNLTLTEANTLMTSNLRVDGVVRLANSSGIANITGTGTVATTLVTATSRIFLTPREATNNVYYVENIVPGVSFDISEISGLAPATDISWMIINQ